MDLSASITYADSQITSDLKVAATPYDKDGNSYEYIAIEQQTNQNKAYQFQYEGNTT